MIDPVGGKQPLSGRLDRSLPVEKGHELGFDFHDLKYSCITIPNGYMPKEVHPTLYANNVRIAREMKSEYVIVEERTGQASLGKRRNTLIDHISRCDNSKRDRWIRKGEEREKKK